MKAVVLGAGGQLAHDLQRAMSAWELVPLRHADQDICDHEAVRRRLGEICPDVVVNTAAFHRVDDCEVEVEKAFQVNAFAVRSLAQTCADIDSTLVHVSTDYVFGGEKRTPYTEVDLPRPLNVYGVSKLAGEHFVRSLCPRHLVIRSSGLYGVAGSSGKGGNFVETMIRMAKEGKPIRVVDDQVLAPTYTKDLAEEIVELLRTEEYGLYHVANGGECSWYEFATEIFGLVSLRPDLGRTTTQAYRARARRPAYSVLASGNRRHPEGVRPWREALLAYLTDMQHVS